MARRRADPDVRQEIAAQLQHAFSRSGLTQAEVARRVGVSRQSVHQCLHAATTPNHHLLALLCQTLGVKKLSYRGRSFPVGALAGSQKPKAPAAKQLSLFSALQALSDRHLVVKIANKRSDTLRLVVEVRFAS